MKREPRSNGDAIEASAADGDHVAAVADLYTRLHPMVWRSLGLAGIADSEERRNLVQDVFVIAIERYPSRDPKVPAAAWLATITWNTARNYRRARMRRARAQLEVTVNPPEPVSNEASPEQKAADRRYLHAVLEGLDDDRRMIFDMHEVQGFEVPDIARAIRVPVGTVRTRLRLAREHVEAAHARLVARTARTERKAAVLPLLPSFGKGAWRELGRAFEEDMPPGMEEQIWRDVCRTIAIENPLGHAATGATVAAKTAGALLGTGALFGGGAVLLALRVFAPTPPDPSITRAPDPVVPTPVAVVSAPSAAAPSALATVRPRGAAAANAAPVISSAVTTATTAKGIDPEEMLLIERAKAALATKRYDAAREALREHEARFPRGQLLADRKALLAQIPSRSATTRPGAPPSPSAPVGGASHRPFGSDD